MRPLFLVHQRWRAVSISQSNESVCFWRSCNCCQTPQNLCPKKQFNKWKISWFSGEQRSDGWWLQLFNLIFFFKFLRPKITYLQHTLRNLHWQSGWHVMKPSSSSWCEATRFISISIFSSPVFTWTLFMPNRMSWSNVRNSHLKRKEINWKDNDLLVFG